MSSDPNNTFFAPSVYCKRVTKNSEEFIDDHISTSSIEVSDPAKILLLCESLTERSTSRLEIKINSYVSIVCFFYIYQNMCRFYLKITCFLLLLDNIKQFFSTFYLLDFIWLSFKM